MASDSECDIKKWVKYQLWPIWTTTVQASLGRPHETAGIKIAAAGVAGEMVSDVWTRERSNGKQDSARGVPSPSAPTPT